MLNERYLRVMYELEHDMLHFSTASIHSTHDFFTEQYQKTKQKTPQQNNYETHEYTLKISNQISLNRNWKF